MVSYLTGLMQSDCSEQLVDTNWRIIVFIR